MNAKTSDAADPMAQVATPKWKADLTEEDRQVMLICLGSMLPWLIQREDPFSKAMLKCNMELATKLGCTLFAEAGNDR